MMAQLWRARVSRTVLIEALLLLQLAVLAIASPAQETARAKPKIVRDQNLMVAMRDGVKLSTSVIRLDAPGKFPALLLRTPYGKTEGEEFSALVPSGYVLVVQDCRGRFLSEGEWNPFFHEAEDGDDTINWVASQPWSDGRVITAGGSYSAMDQWLAATRHNPHLKGMISMVCPSDFYHGVVYQGGAMNQGALEMWAYFTAGHKLSDPAAAPAPWDKVFRFLPAVEGLSVLNLDVNFYREWIAHPLDDVYWRRLEFDKLYSTFDIPVLNFTGWYDMFQAGTIENFRRMHDQAPPSVRGRQFLIVGPWGHNSYSRKVGEVDFGEEASPNVIPLFVSWLESVLGGKESELFQKPVHIFTMGENSWHDYSTWPVPGAEVTKYFLHGEGASNSSDGSGLLTTAPEAAHEKSDTYRYDPTDPVPTRGGGNCCWPKLVSWGPINQNQVEKRPDVLIYSSPVLAQDVRVTGPVSAQLWVSSSAPDTDFTVKLVDDYPDGFAMNLTDGVLRARYRHSFEHPELLKPGQPYQITVDLGATSNLFKAGHRIRAEISSSNFPHFSRNTNTGHQPETDSKTEVAEQTILHDSKHPSYILLSVLH